METIQILHTNDIHSHLENWPRIHQFLQQKKGIHQDRGEDVFLFDIGDFIDRWHPFTEATRGQGNINLLNESGYTAVTIGNNEGINLPHNDLHQLYEKAEFDVLLANFYEQNHQTPHWVKPYKIYSTSKGTRIAVLGFTANFAHLYELLGWKLTDPKSELEKWLPILKEQSDIIIILSHLGLQEDIQIATEFPAIDVILGGHTHHVLEQGRMVGETLLGAAGKYGYHVGQVTLTLNEDKTIQNKQAILYDTKDLSTVDQETEQVDAFLTRGKKLLNKKVKSLRKTLLADPFQETNLSRMLCEALGEWCSADCAMINAGLLLGSLSGDITEYDLLTICPHPINPCVVELTGNELKKILLQTEDKTLAHKQIQGLGFRGTVLGVFIYDRICFVNNMIIVNGRELDLDGKYRLALPDMFTFGHFFKDVLPHKQKKYFLPEFLRDILRWKLQGMS